MDTGADELRHFEVGLDRLGGSDQIGWMDLEWVVGCKSPILQGRDTQGGQSRDARFQGHETPNSRARDFPGVSFEGKGV